MIFFAVGLGTLAGGIFTEKKENYKVLGRVLIGGGWAITFFTTYGMRHVPGIQIMASDVADLILMLLVLIQKSAQHSAAYPRPKRLQGLKLPLRETAFRPG